MALLMRVAGRRRRWRRSRARSASCAPRAGSRAADRGDPARRGALAARRRGRRRRAADMALAAASEQGSNHHLLKALADFPAVLARRLDAEAGRRLALARARAGLMAQGAAIDFARAPARAEEFGRRADRGRRRARCAPDRQERRAAGLPGGGARSRAEREGLLDALFGGRADESARAYLRQAVHRLRAALPDGVGPALRRRRSASTSRSICAASPGVMPALS